jgi:hypothetical protein
MDETACGSCAIAPELVIAIKTRSNHGRTTALRVKVFGIEERKTPELV